MRGTVFFLSATWSTTRVLTLWVLCRAIASPCLLMDNSRTPECKFLNFFPPFSYRDLYTNRSSKRFPFFSSLSHLFFFFEKKQQPRERERHLSVGSRQQQQLSELFQKLSKRNGSSRRNGQKHTPRVPCIHLSRISISSRTQLLRESSWSSPSLFLLVHSMFMLYKSIFIIIIIFFGRRKGIYAKKKKKKKKKKKERKWDSV